MFGTRRFKSRELLDDAAVLTRSMYVDLNQVRAGLATSLEESRHSAIRQRILAAKDQEARVLAGCAAARGCGRGRLLAGPPDRHAPRGP